jgi:hypothetical protein
MEEVPHIGVVVGMLQENPGREKILQTPGPTTDSML